MQISLLRPDALPAQALSAWDEIQRGDAELRSPYFHPDFTRCVAAVRNDVEVALLEKGNETVGLFPFQRGPRRGEGRPVGGRLSDFHGVLLRPGATISLEALLKGCRLTSFAFHHLIVSRQPFESAFALTSISPYLDLSHGYDGYRKQRNDAGIQDIRQTERKLRKLEREKGPVRFEFETCDDVAFEKLVRWKSTQYRETGLTDVFAFPWTVNLLKQLQSNPNERLRGILSTLYQGERLVAVHYGMRGHDVMHSWFPAYDRELARYSPGMIMFLKLAEGCAARGITRLDLGKGDETYKVNLASGTETVAEGFVEHSLLARTARRLWGEARTWVKSSPALRAITETPLRLIRPFREKRAFQ